MAQIPAVFEGVVSGSAIMTAEQFGKVLDAMGKECESYGSVTVLGYRTLFCSGGDRVLLSYDEGSLRHISKTKYHRAQPLLQSLHSAMGAL